MNTTSERTSLLLLAAASLACAAATQQPDATRFAAPVRLHAGDKLLGQGRLYPSPVSHDVNGDGLRDIVVGDLHGHLTYALRQPGDGPATFGEEQKLNDAEGKILDFGNW